MPAPRIAFEDNKPQLPIVSAPSGLPFLGGDTESPAEDAGEPAND